MRTGGHKEKVRYRSRLKTSLRKLSKYNLILHPRLILLTILEIGRKMVEPKLDGRIFGELECDVRITSTSMN